MGMTIDELRAVLANLGQDLSEYSDDEVSAMLDKQQALQDEAEAIKRGENGTAAS